MAGTPVEVDYLDERKFAKIAAAKARCGAEIIDLTYRQHYTEDPEEQWQGYMDTDPERAWGVSEWACRAGQGALFDWAVANALLPSDDLNDSRTGIQRINRTTVVELREVASSFIQIQMQQNKADMGLNPLGVAKDAMPFDINPYELVDAGGQPSGRTHFEQIYDRAMQSLNNAVTAFNYANQNTQLIRNQQDTIEDFNDNVEDREADLNSRLIEVFGYPYGDDIGPTGAYPAGYEGPDIYHYMYVDSSELIGVTPVETETLTVTVKDLEVDDDGALVTSENDVEFTLSQNGLGLIKPLAWTQARKAPGEIQMARSDLLQAKIRFDKGLKDYDALLKQIESQVALLDAQYDLNAEEITFVTEGEEEGKLSKKILAYRTSQLWLEYFSDRAERMAEAVAEFLPQTIGLEQ